MATNDDFINFFCRILGQNYKYLLPNKRKIVYKIDAWVNAIKRFMAVIYNKTEFLSLPCFTSLVYCLCVRPEAHPIPENCITWVGSSLTRKL
jgi:hypothetical protein